MSTSVNGLTLRRVLGRDTYGPPTPFGPDGWSLTRLDGHGMVIVTCAEQDDEEWVHASISRDDRLPTYDELCELHRAVWPRGFAVQSFVPPDRHVNIHARALHLWGRLDGARLLPDFGAEGTI